jgi:molybdate transport system substrate-binding protein
MLKKTALLLLLSLLEAFSAFAGEIRLSVAASLTDAVTEICVDYARAHPGTTCLPNFGASGTLAKQIAQGAPADLFISANPQWIDYLLGEKKIAADTVKPLAANRLVFVGAKGTEAASLADLPKLKRIAIGSPKSVPAGQYAEEAMKKADVYDQLVNDRKLVLALDVRQALVYADRGETDGAFVYKTDALLAKEATILFEVPRDFHMPITYPMALTVAGRANPEAQDFFRYLSSAEAGKVLTKFGFVLE